MSLRVATVRYLCGLGCDDVGSSDADLLGRFIDHRDEAAFALLVRRHGDMVYGVCHRLLPTEQDAEDAFQATFLVLAEKARTVAPREAVGNWLYGVARRAALLARRSIARRRERMTELTDLPTPAPDPLAELRAALDEEVSRLPDLLRTVIILCDLEGRTRKEAAAMLGWPEGTVAGRLAQARRFLAKRLVRHAPTVSVAAVLASTSRAPAAVLALMVPSERQVPAAVAALTQAVLAGMTGGKVMKTMIAVLVLSCAGLGMSLGAGQDKGPSPTPNAPGNTAVAEKLVKADPVVFWGEEVDGLKAGLSLVETPRIEKDGGSARLEVKFKLHIRNVSMAPVTINYGAPREDKPTVLDGAGDTVRVTMPPIHFGSRPIYSRVIEPGETFTPFDHELIVEMDAKQPLQSGVKVPTVRVPQGKYTISYSGIVSSHKRLATGNLPFDVVDPEKTAKADLAEDKVAWGKEVDGLQAGLSLVEAKTEREGDTVKLVVKMEVKVRNVGKALATITYGSPWERSPTITDAAGKEVPVQHSDFWIAPILLPFHRVIEPGKTFSLSHPEFTLEVDAKQPVPEGITERTVRVRPGAYTISYDWVADSHKELATGGLPFKVMNLEKVAKADLEDSRVDDKVAWGKKVNGLQAGLRSPKHVLGRGESVEVELVLKNAGTSAIVLDYPTNWGLGGTPDRGSLRLGWGSRNTPLRRAETSLPPGGVVVRGRVTLASNKAVALGTGVVRLGPGKYWVSVPDVGGAGDRLSNGGPMKGAEGKPETPEWIDLPELGTGGLEVIVTDKEPPTKESVDQEIPQRKKEAEGFTAWGEEINGLQAGLSQRSSGEYASEMSTLIVRVRNVGKETVKFSYLQPFVEHSFTVIGGDGKPVPQPKILSDIGERNAGIVELAPGKEIVLHEFKRRFLPAGKGGSDDAWKKPYALYHGTGKIGIRYDQVFGTPGMGLPGWKLDPALSKLATGTLETTLTDMGELGEPDDGPRGAVEGYVAAALACRVDDAIGLAVKEASPAKRERVEEFAKRIEAIRVPTVYVSEDEALAVSEVVKLAREQPDGASKVILVFKVVKLGGRWLVKDIDITTELDAKERVETFKTKHPAATTVPADVTPKSASENKLVGTWKLVSAKYDGETVKFPEGFTTVKHVTPTQFMWASYGKDGKVTRTAGGSYSLKDDVYEETPEYGVGKDFDGIKGKAQTFKWKVEGNRWHHTGKLDNGPTIDEVWERVERK